MAENDTPSVDGNGSARPSDGEASPWHFENEPDDETAKFAAMGAIVGRMFSNPDWIEEARKYGLAAGDGGLDQAAAHERWLDLSDRLARHVAKIPEMFAGMRPGPQLLDDMRNTFGRAYRRALRLNPQRGTVLPVPPAELVLSPAAWMARNLPPPDYLMGELFSTTSRVLLSADTGLGKSMFALGLAMAMSQGRDFLHWTCKRPARVLLIDGEMPLDLLQERIGLACQWFGIEPPDDGLMILSRDDVEESMPPLDSPEGAEWLLGFVQACRAEFVIFDNIMSLTVGDLREEATARALVPLSRELSRRKVGQLWLHHVGHDKGRVYGPKLLQWQMDAVGLGEFISDPDASVAFKLTWTKHRRRTPANRADFDLVHIRLADGVWNSTPAPAENGTAGQLSRSRPPSPSGRLALDALQKAISAAGERPPYHEETSGVHSAVRVRTWRTYFSQIAGYGLDPKDKEAERRAWNRGRENAQATTRVRVWGEWCWIPEPSGTLSGPGNGTGTGGTGSIDPLSRPVPLSHPLWDCPGPSGTA